MSASSVAALAVCARLARRTGDAGWALWTAAMSVFVGSLVLRAWPGPIAGDRATALRLASSATAAIAAAGVARRLPGGVSRVTALDMVPPVLAVSAVSIVGAAGQVNLGYSDAVTHVLYPSAYAALLLLATELGVRRRGRPLSGDALAGAGLVAVALAAMWATTGTRFTADWAVTVPDALRSAGFVLLAAAGLRIRQSGRSHAAGADVRVAIVPAVAVVALCAMAIGSNGSNGRVLSVLAALGFAAFVARLLIDRRRMRALIGRIEGAEERYRGLIERLPLIVYEDKVDEYSTSLFISPQTIEFLGYTPEEWQSQRDFFLQVVHPDDRERVMGGMSEASHTDVHTTEYRVFAKDGRIVWIRDEAAIVWSSNGEPMCWQGMMLDITSQKDAE